MANSGLITFVEMMTTDCSATLYELSGRIYFRLQCCYNANIDNQTILSDYKFIYVSSKQQKD
ncbi:MAG: hypothetical protein IH618_15505 [Ignavibacteriaceae bacterium]|nr:hypothetical protein [Ignavibacteriaceae bacterium]